MIRKGIAIFILLQVIGCGGAKPSATLAPQTSNGIVNGTTVPATDALAKSIVALVFKAKENNVEKTALCTGTILDSETILTAAHCVKDVDKMAVVFTNDLSQLTQATATDLVRKMDRTAINSLYTGNDNDVALVHFVGGLPAGFVPVQLINSDIQLGEGTQLHVMGFGVSDPTNNQGAGVLRQTDSPLLGGQDDWLVSDESHTGVCFGDSGGPAFVQQNGQWIQIGVAHAVTDNKCSQYATHLNLGMFIPWIQQTSAALKLGPVINPTPAPVPAPAPAVASN
jgi:secreted trypsin-like serine protease